MRNEKTIVNQEFDIVVKDGVVPDMDIDKAQEIISELKEHGWTICAMKFAGNKYGCIEFVSEVSAYPVSVFIWKHVCFGDSLNALNIPMEVVNLFDDLAEMINSQEDIITLYMLSKAEEPLKITEDDQKMRLDYKEAAK